MGSSSERSKEIMNRHAAIAGSSPHAFVRFARDGYGTPVIRNDAVALRIGFVIYEKQKCPPVDFVDSAG
jgi:hypothetical protein